MSTDTKSKIVSTFWDLAHSMPANKITVGILTEKCGISRQSFYYHFHDIMEVLSWSISTNIQKVFTQTEKCGSDREALSILIRLFIENVNRIEPLFTENAQPKLRCLFLDSLQESLKEFCNRRHASALQDAAERDLACIYFSGAIVSTIEHITKEGLCDIDALTESLLSLMEKSFTDIYGGVR